MRFLLSATAIAVSISMTPLVLAGWGDNTASFVTATEGAASHQTLVDHQGNIIVGYSDPNTGYDFLVNKLDRHGNFAWQQGAKTLYDRQQSYILTWSMALDDEGAIYTGFEDLSIYPHGTMIFKTNADGSAGWPTPFIPSPEDAGRTLPVHITSSRDKLFYALDYSTMSRTDKVAVGMLDKQGNELWHTAEQMGSTRFSSFVAVQDGLVVLFSGIRADGNNSMFIQKYNFDGKPLWGDSPQPIMFGDISLPARSSGAAAMIADGQGGVAIAWSHPTLSNSILLYQHVDAKGTLQFPNSGLRLSHGDDMQFNNTAHPSIVATDDGYVITWAAQYSNTNFGNYGLFMHAIGHDGTLLLGSEPTSLVPILYGENQDSGYYSAGYLSQYNSTFSYVYAKSDDYTSETENLYRVDFKADGTVLNNHIIAKVDQVINGESITHSPFGETVASFRISYDRDAEVQLQSIKQNGEVGNEAGLRLAWPEAPLRTNEDETLSVKIPFVDEQHSNYKVSASSVNEDDGTQYSAQLTTDSVQLTITPAAEFSGKIPFIISLTDDKDTDRTHSMTYILNVSAVNDAPSITMPEQVTVSEDDTVVVSAEVTDPDNTSLNIEWLQTGGPAVDFDPTAMELSFHSPVVNEQTSLSFSLVVDDGTSVSTEHTRVIVSNDKQPTLTGTHSVNVEEGNNFTIDITLNAAKGPVAIAWQQLSGPAIILSNPNSLVTQGSAPFVNSDQQASLALNITDANGETATHQVNINVTNNQSGGSVGISLVALLSMLLCRRQRRVK